MKKVRASRADVKRVRPMLRDVLESFREIISVVEDGELHQRAVQVVISGDRPKSAISEDARRFVGIDINTHQLDQLREFLLDR